MSKIIDSIKFGLLPPDEVRKLSAVEIQTSDTYDEDGAPIAGGLMDHRLGTLEPRQRCQTCGNIALNCPGHFGHIELAVPVIHVEFAKQIYRLLTATCRGCGRILLPDEGNESITSFQRKREEDLKLFGKVTDDTINDILKVAKKYKRGKECPHCGMPQTNVTLRQAHNLLRVRVS